MHPADRTAIALLLVAAMVAIPAATAYESEFYYTFEGERGSEPWGYDYVEGVTFTASGNTGVRFDAPSYNSDYLGVEMWEASREARVGAAVKAGDGGATSVFVTAFSLQAGTPSESTKGNGISTGAFADSIQLRMEETNDCWDFEIVEVRGGSEDVIASETNECPSSSAHLYEEFYFHVDLDGGEAKGVFSNGGVFIQGDLASYSASKFLQSQWFVGKSGGASSAETDLKVPLNQGVNEYKFAPSTSIQDWDRQPGEESPLLFPPGEMVDPNVEYDENGDMDVYWQDPWYDGGTAVTYYQATAFIDDNQASSNTQLPTTHGGTSQVFAQAQLSTGIHHYEFRVPDGDWQPDTEYCVVIEAVNRIGTGDKGVECERSPSTPETPQSVRASQEGSQVRLDWDGNPSGPTPRYDYVEIFRDSGNGFQEVATRDGNYDFWYDTATSVGSTYTYRLVGHLARFSSGNSNTVTITIQEGASVPTAPQAVTVYCGQFDTCNDHLQVSWEQPASNGGATITGYEVLEGASVVRSVAGNVETTTVNALTPDTEYCYTVRALNSEGTGPASSSVCMTTDAIPETKPTVPRNFLGSSGDTQVTLNWDAPESWGNGANREYRIYSYQASSVIYSGPAGTRTFTHTGLTNDDTYTYSIQAKTDHGYSQTSNIIAVTPSGTANPPAAPQNLARHGTDFSHDRARLVWSPPNDDGGDPVTGYNVYVGGSFVAQVNGGGTEYEVTGLSPSTYYCATVSAINGVGEGPLSSPGCFTTPSEGQFLPGEVRFFQAEPIIEGARLQWSPPADWGTGYDPAFHVTMNGQFYRSYSSTATNVFVVGLDPQQNYTFQIVAVTTNGNGPYSSSLTVQPTAQPPMESGEEEEVAEGNTTTMEPPTSTGGVGGINDDPAPLRNTVLVGLSAAIAVLAGGLAVANVGVPRKASIPLAVLGIALALAFQFDLFGALQ